MHNAHVCVSYSLPRHSLASLRNSANRTGVSERRRLRNNTSRSPADTAPCLPPPEACRKLQPEIGVHYSSKSADDDGLISYSGAKYAPYLRGAIRKGLHLRQPSAGLFSKEVTQDGDASPWHYLPPGAEIRQSTYCFGKMERICGNGVLTRTSSARSGSLRLVPRRSKRRSRLRNWCLVPASNYTCLWKLAALIEQRKFFVEACRLLTLVGYEGGVWCEMITNIMRKGVSTNGAKSPSSILCNR